MISFSHSNNLDINDEILKQYIQGLSGIEEESIMKKSKKSRILVFYGKILFLIFYYSII